MGAVMELELLNKDAESMAIKIIGEDHTFCNVLRKALHEDEDIAIASYAIEHPLLSHPTFFVKVKKGKSPERALVEAAERIIEKCDDLRKKLSKALKK